MKDLLKLYSIESVHDTDGEQEIFKWLCQYLDNLNVEYKTLGNNIYKLTGNKVILSAHLDQVKTNGKAEHFFMFDNKIIKGYNKNYQRTSLGADDKNGVWIILKMLENCSQIDFIISCGEEAGCVGIKELEQAGVLNCISDKQICLVLDRKGNKDILKGGASDVYCSTLAQDLCNFIDDNMVVTTGSISDTRVICEHCESVNMSTAYFNPHTENEETDFDALENLLDIVSDIVYEFRHYPTKPSIYVKKKVYNSYNKNSFYYGRLDDELL